MSFGPQLFDPATPYPSLVYFTENHKNHKRLYPNQKESFILDIESFFSKRAYNNVSEPISPTETESFASVAETLRRVAKKIDLKDRRVRIPQLLANIAKVCGIALGSVDLSKKPLFHIHIAEGEDRCVYWGWIEGSYVLESEKLLGKIKAGKLEFESKELKPQVLLALQRAAAFRVRSKERKESLDITEAMISELEQFAQQWEIPSLDQLVKKIRASSLRLTHVNDAERGTPCKSNPYQTMVQFTGRCCALSTSDQLRFLSAVRYFFSTAYNKNPVVPIPNEFKERFAQVSLPFLLDTMPLKKSKLHQFLDNVRTVTGESFGSASPCNVRPPSIPLHDVLMHAMGTESTSHPKEYAFLNAFVPKAKDENVVDSAVYLIDLHQLETTHTAWLVQFLKRNEGKGLFTREQQATVYPRLLRLLERIPASKTFAATFIVRFQKEIGATFGGSSLRCSTEVLTHYVEMIHLSEGGITSEMISKTGPGGTLERFYWIEAVVLMENPSIGAWLRENGGELIKGALIESLKESAYQFMITKQVYDFLIALKNSGATNNLCEFLAEALLNHIPNSIQLWKNFETVQGKREVSNHLKESALRHTLTKTDVQQAFTALCNPLVGGKLTGGDLPTAANYLKSFLLLLHGLIP